MKRTLVHLFITLALATGLSATPTTLEPQPAAAATMLAGSTFGTLAERNAYVRCVAPATEVSLSLRVRLLTYAGRALEGIRADVPAWKVTRTLRIEYRLTAAEASRVYWCVVKVWG